MLLRVVTASDLPVFFEHQCDPAACHMAAFTAREPANRQAFDAHWTRILADASIVIRAIVVDVDAGVVGHVLSYLEGGEREVSYWIGRPHWGRGVATQALRQFLAERAERPLYARAAKDNLASIRVLERCGFKACGEGRGFAEARGAEIEELVFRLAETAVPATP